MKFITRKSTLSGSLTIPGSKSHTIRGLLFATLADGTSRLLRPLDSSDTRSCVQACTALGADVATGSDDCWEIRGTAGSPVAPDAAVNVGNSGTTLFLAMSAAALGNGLTEFTGDQQTRRRDASPLLGALSKLGATARSVKGNGCAPLIVGGGLKGGNVSIKCPTSQYLSSLLLGCPLAERDSDISVPLLHEKPYVGMTCQWLEELGVSVECTDGYSRIHVPGGQRYHAFERVIPADFSSATFFLVAAAITGSELMLRGLDMNDSQGDKAVVGMLRQMGCSVDEDSEGLWIRGPDRLQGASFDLNATPDALPAMAVAGCAAEGTTRLTNVPQARMKETDRIWVMSRELSKMGGEISELPDGVEIEGTTLEGAEVNGHCDHRVIMALSVAGLAAGGRTVVDTAEAVDVTFPDFHALMREAGADIESS
ncbi:MAG: 3-phosphoshikimate 1-carboxyvinyltransferase [Planctomycetota bacterium]